ncbi:MAG: F0F1 ATP synthase subunit epsilon [Pseudomonadota bacterium]|nr:F0F1 ATP synthase subunit epsilon [Alphaproteobacteria bacterium]MEC7463054.1 F0F1 ATP synthase subunit epsilon [Pseudomonadota bacterium]MEC7944121.1 F0F1 ATP synthase subunit epsilon [Pseudomonadota bacterium]MEC8086741.1 F0F1 ATP synthase subunit epsilon [Pseudomonadota bacterium]MEC8290114.1 F0F1 ATP synthase subunit epsilon [Pseudomonadota bacterium]
MAEEFSFELVSPEKLLLAEEVDMVVVPGAEGDFGVLVGHAPLISSLRPGVIDTYNGGKVADRIFVAGGFAEVTGERCTVLAEEAIPVKDIDSANAEERLKVAKEAISGADNDTLRNAAEIELTVAEAMLAAGRAA